ncbi:MAG: DUF3006 domain-containing protein [Pyrinomonas sp.]|uniref:DUF3006 domain-containing protein n=1 Tax=Pyrinomonas sp. TaxID=2080306 RepID=UPI003318F967
MTDEAKDRREVTIHAVVDRIEDGDWAVLLLGDDERGRADFPRAYLPAGSGEGTHLRIRIEIDEESQQRAEEETRRLLERLQQRSRSKGKKDFKL